MRIVGYVRQGAGRTDADSAFAQSERVRRWVRDTGHDLVAICQDSGPLGSASDELDRPGYRALLDIVRADDADAVVVGSLGALSSDVVLQEIMIADIRSAGATVIATDEADIAILLDADEDHVRMIVRDVVDRVIDYRARFTDTGAQERRPDDHDGGDDDGSQHVVIRLIEGAGGA